MPDKIIILFLLIAGLGVIAYGMIEKNNYVFIIGIVMFIAGYCLIRKKLKRTTNNKSKSENPEKNT